LTLDQFIFWPKLPPNARFGIKNLKTFSGGDTPDPSARGGDPLPHQPSARLHAMRGGASSPVAGTYRVAQNKIPHWIIYNISATSGLIFKILEAA